MARPIRKGDTIGTIASNLKVFQTGETLDADTLPVATTSVQGALSAADKAKLDGIEEGADVTDSDNVAAAGAIVDQDLPDLAGEIVRQGAGFYSVIKHNLTATVAPTANDDSTLAYGVGSKWVDIAGNRVWFCADTAVGAAIWKEAGGAGGSGLPDGDYTDVTVSGGTTVITINPDAVTNAKLAEVATATLKGRATAGTGNPEDLTAAQARALLNVEDGATANPNAFESSVSGEIAALTEKVAPAAGDHLLIEDSADADSKKRVQIGNLPAGTPADNSITNTKLADVASPSFKGRVSASAGDPEDLTVTQATGMLNEFVGDSGSGGTKGMVPAPASGDATKFLRGDKTWQSIGGGGDALTSNPLSQFAATTSAQLAGVLTDETGTGAAVFGTSPTLTTPTIGVATATSVNKVAITAPASAATLTIADGATLTASATATVSGTNTGDQSLTGDVTGSGTPTITATIANDAVTNAKLANVATATIKGRATAGTGDVEDLSVSQTVTLLGAEVTANKGVASGYAPVDSRIFVPQINIRPRRESRHVFEQQAQANAPLYNFTGYGTPLTESGIMSNVRDVDGSWIRHTTENSSSGEAAGLEGPHFQYVQARWFPRFTAYFRSPATLTNCQLWIGFESSPILTQTAPVGKNIAAMRYVDGTDTKWTTYTCDGTASATANTNNFAATVASSTIYSLSVSIESGKVVFWANDVKCTTDHTATLPTSDVWLSPVWLLTTGTTAQRYWDGGRFVLEHF